MFVYISVVGKTIFWISVDMGKAISDIGQVRSKGGCVGCVRSPPPPPFGPIMTHFRLTVETNYQNPNRLVHAFVCDLTCLVQSYAGQIITTSA